MRNIPLEAEYRQGGRDQCLSVVDLRILSIVMLPQPQLVSTPSPWVVARTHLLTMELVGKLPLGLAPLQQAVGQLQLEIFRLLGIQAAVLILQLESVHRQTRRLEVAVLQSETAQWPRTPLWHSAQVRLRRLIPATWLWVRMR